MNLADLYVQRELGVDISRIKQRIAVLPPGVSKMCRDWLGLGSLGCTGTRCYTWVRGDVARQLHFFMHEMGHNMWLQHSGDSWFVTEYGDTTCTMGLGTTCFNAPNMWRLGWVSPVLGGDLNGSTLDVGRTRTFLLPGQTRATRSILRIDPTWVLTDRDVTSSGGKATHLPVYYVSVRERQPPFEDTGKAFVAVYTSQVTRSDNSTERSIKQSTMLAGGEFRAEMPYGIVVRVASIGAGGANATVSICRASGEREAQGGASCSDGLDNDCDGLVVRLRRSRLHRGADIPIASTHAAVTAITASAAATDTAAITIATTAFTAAAADSSVTKAVATAAAFPESPTAAPSAAASQAAAAAAALITTVAATTEAGEAAVTPAKTPSCRAPLAAAITAPVTPSAVPPPAPQAASGAPAAPSAVPPPAPQAASGAPAAPATATPSAPQAASGAPAAPATATPSAAATPSTKSLLDSSPA
ncbi:hypothetical protein PLESTM_001918500 [Pleodorina starrii]|nr:hypothetical protein PLESTM_001918500 [Pleodorina starrii]